MISVAFTVAGNIHASDPFGVVQRSVIKLFVEPLRIAHAQLIVVADPFPAECSAHAITIRVVVPTKAGHSEVLKVDAVVVDDRLQFLAASGSALRGGDHRSSNESMNNSINFIAQINGWKLIDEPPRRGARSEYLERRMRDPHPQPDYEPNVKTIVFDQRTGMPILVGSPPSPTANNCGG
jgi:hypothetical protein